MSSLQQMKNKAIKLVDDEAYDEAYELFSNILMVEPRNNQVRYYRAVIDFFHIKNNIMSTYNDLKKLVDQKTKYFSLSLPLLVSLCEQLSLYKDTVHYARMALKQKTIYDLEMRTILIKALKETDNFSDLLESLAIVEEIINEDPDDAYEYYFYRIEILLKLNQIDEARQNLETLFTKFPANGMMYFIKGKIIYASYVKDKNKELLNEANETINIALQYDEEIIEAILLKAEILALNDKLDEALQVIDDIRKTSYFINNNKDKTILEADLVVEKVKICEIGSNWSQAIKTCEDFLAHYQSWKVDYSLGYLKNVSAYSLTDLQEAKKYILKAYDVNPELYFVADVYYINFILHQHLDNYKIIEKQLAINPRNGYLHFLKAESLTFLDTTSYEEIIMNYQYAKKYGYLDHDAYINIVCNMVENPKIFYKKMQKLSKKVFSNDFSTEIKRKMGIRFLYGEDGIKQDIPKSVNILKMCNTTEPNDPCYMGSFARALQLNGDYQEAFKIYNQAYEIYNSDIKMTCNCICAYLADCYIRGLGTNKDEEKAKSIILETIKRFDKSSCSEVLIIYGYFSLTGDDRFVLTKALEYLFCHHYFYRYDISKALIANAISKKLNLELRYTTKDIKKILKYSGKDCLKYYQDNKDKDIVYPYYKSI